jgi:IS605 OrfB family transposase
MTTTRWCSSKRLARNRHHLDAADQALAQWRTEWDASRWFITADGEADKTWGNETIRWHPLEDWLEIKLPAALAKYANRPFGRYRLSCLVSWPYRGGDVAAQATNGAVRYDITYKPARDRWYIDASWALHAQAVATLDQLRYGSVVSVDLNVGHLAVSALDPYGNPLGPPITIPLELAGLSATTRDGHLRAAISQILAMAETHHAGAVVIEDLDFVEQRTEGREHAKDRPSRGRRGKAFRRQISGLPTAQFRDRLTQMAYNAGVAVIAVGPAYTSLWGRSALARASSTAVPTIVPHWSPRSCGGYRQTRARPAGPATGDARSTLTRRWATSHCAFLRRRGHRRCKPFSGRSPNKQGPGTKNRQEATTGRGYSGPERRWQ